MEGASPARVYATLVGGALAIFGLAGFFYDSGFETGDSLGAHDALGIFAVNGWLNVVHLLTGALGVALASRRARGYALALGWFYLLIAVAGVLQLGGGDSDSILQLIPVDTAGNLLHLVLGMLGLAAAAATPGGRRRPRRKRPPKPKG